MARPETGVAPSLSQQLDRFDLKALLQMARALQVGAEGDQRPLLVEALAGFIGSPHHRQVLELALDRDDWGLLTLLPVRGGSFRLRVMLAFLRQRRVAAAALARVARLLQHGGILPVSASAFAGQIGIETASLAFSATYVQFVLAPAVSEWALDHVPVQTGMPAEPPETVVQPALLDLQRAVFIVLSEASQQPLRMAAGGTPYKADLNRLARSLVAAAGRTGPEVTEEVMPILWFALGALMGSRILEEDDDELEEACGRSLPQNVRYSLEEWVRLYEGLWLRERACLLEASSPEQLDAWLTDPAMAQLLGRRLGPAAVLVPAGNAPALGERLSGAGVDVAVSSYAQPPAKVLRLRDPDLIEVERSRLEPYLQYRLGVFSVPAGETPERVRYRITPESVRDAASSGWTGSQLAGFLATAAGRVLTPEMVSRIHGWSGAAVYAAESLVAVVIPEQPVPAVVLRQIPAIGELIRALPTPTLALVAPADLPALRAALEARGFALADQVIEAGALQDQAAAPRPSTSRKQA